MASSLLTAATCQMAAGTPRYTSPDPVRTAARLAKTGAPVKPTQPHRHITLPNMPLCPAGSRRGRLRQTAPAVISSIRPPPFLYTPIV